MGCFYIFDENYVDSDLFNGFDKSSENASYPASNLYAFKRRHKVWRSSGFWEVTSSNNQIVFRDDTSTNLTASIATGNYTSTTSFMAAIDTALEAVGAASYTVSLNTTTGAIKLSSDLSGGATAFQLITTHANFTAASMLGFDTGANKTGASNYTADLLRIHTSEWLELDCGVSTLIQAVALIGKRNKALGISSSSTVKVQGNTTNVWTSPQYEATLEYNEQGMYSLNTAGLDSSYRYWRLYIEDKDNPNGYVELSKIFIGEVWSTERGASQFGFSNNMIDLSVTAFSEMGVALSDVKPKRQEFAFEFSFLTKADAERLEDIFDRFGTSKSFFVVFDDNEAFSTANQRWLKLVKFSDEPNIVLNTPNNFSAQLKLREEL